MQQIMTATPYLHYIKLRSCIPIITSFFGKTVINLKLIAKVPQNTHKNSFSGAALWIKVTFLTTEKSSRAQNWRKKGDAYNTQRGGGGVNSKWDRDCDISHAVVSQIIVVPFFKIPYYIFIKEDNIFSIGPHFTKKTSSLTKFGGNTLTPGYLTVNWEMK